MPPQYFERSNGNSVAGSPLTPRRLSEVRAESGTQGKGEPFQIDRREVAEPKWQILKVESRCVET